MTIGIAIDLRARDAAGQVDLDTEMDRDERLRLSQSIASSREEYDRGEGLPASVLLDDIDRFIAQG